MRLLHHPKDLSPFSSTLKTFKRCTPVCIPIWVLLLAFPAFGQNEATEYFKRGLTYHMGDGVPVDEDQALRDYRKSLKIDPEFFQSLYNSGLIYHSAGKLKHAQAVFLKAARVAQKDGGANAKHLGALARNGLGTTLFLLEKFAESEKQFDIARRLFPSFVEAHYNYINSLIRDDRVEEANEAIRLANIVAPSDRYERFKGFAASKSTLKRFYDIGSWLFAIAVTIVAILYGLHIRSKKRRSSFVQRK
ncbi:MAG: tetratricopeptide repeat protein [Candidatus Latescibacterota bacterium]|nr:tetratricopeptide repeat protein [Candidatus Latescibacterota bacterium]